MAKNKKDGKTYAAKIRFNPATERKTRNDKDLMLFAYKRFIREVVGMRKCNHENIVKFIEALRNYEGDLFIIMDQCDISL